MRYMGNREEARVPGGAGEFLTTEDLAAMLRCSVESVRSWRKKGIGPRYLRLPTSRTVAARRATSPVLYRRTDVDAWLEAADPAQTA